MDIYNFALQFEKDGEAFYRASAAALKDKNLADILLFLAGEEHKHYELLERLKKGEGERPSSIFVSDVTNVFSRMKAKNEGFVDPKDTVTDIFTKAMKIEDESVAYYDKASREAADPKAKNLLGALKRQEEAHYSLLSSIIEYYETPNLWMEQAEFHNIKDY